MKSLMVTAVCLNVSEIGLFMTNYKYSATASFLSHPEAHIAASQTYLWPERHDFRLEDKFSEELSS